MKTRVRILSLLFIIAFVAAGGRLFFLQVIKASQYDSLAQQQQSVERAVEARRGHIFIRADRSVPEIRAVSEAREVDSVRYFPAAMTKRWWDTWIVPKDIPHEDRERVVRELAEVLDMNEAVLRERVYKEDDPYEPLKNRVSDSTIEALQALDIPALGWRENPDRFYPFETTAAHLLGFVGRTRAGDRIGQYGIEEHFHRQLAGEQGFVRGFRNPFGFLIRQLSSVAPASDGADLYTTIDYNIQVVLERELERARDRHSAERGIGIVVDPRDGAVRAIAVTPSFNPNEYQSVDSLERFINPAVQSLFEPGSVFKPITMAVALDINVITPQLTYTDEGSVEVSDRTIRNATRESYGSQTMTQVLEKSLNTGVVFAIQRVPAGVWREYLEKFGFAERTGIDVAGEARGNIQNLLGRGEVEIATSSFGQGIATTPLALTMAISAIANGGTLLTPYVVESIVFGDGSVEERGERQERRQVIRPETAEAVTQMLVSVIDRGSGQRAQIPGYTVAGKTGTAQIPSPQGGYLENETVHSFIGYAPAFDPTFVLFVMLENPRGVRFAEGSVVPVFKEVGEFILRYDRVEPDRPVR